MCKRKPPQNNHIWVLWLDRIQKLTFRISFFLFSRLRVGIHCDMLKVWHKVILDNLIVLVPIKSCTSLYMSRKRIKILCNLRLKFYRNFLICLLEKAPRLLIPFNSSRFLCLFFWIIVSFRISSNDLSTRPVILDSPLLKGGK